VPDLARISHAIACAAECKYGFSRRCRLPGLSQWARLGSNQRPLACEASALPLSYAPGAHYFSRSRARRVLQRGLCKALCKAAGAAGLEAGNEYDRAALPVWGALAERLVHDLGPDESDASFLPMAGPSAAVLTACRDRRNLWVHEPAA
jgi:hypothetical protein